ncbi:hypothetical protein TSAR_004282 [Trichomalopsis sarcophagae]|uniref:Endonuclease/exonuclease/phosphatase domain-containing protein n=1 Tax=Trichomalopsis sarcophagae TaxID=543379 RepID=A0A232EEP9_9HYME|nr:hypothetical protein TSAR_004282 [Trichomalopsis sarcophagae]
MNPRLIVHDIPVELTSDQIVSCIIDQNIPDATREDMKHVYIYPARDKKSRSCVVETKPMFRYALLNRKRVNIDWSACRILDHVVVKQCIKCQRFCHIAREGSKDACCAGTHKSRTCKKRDFLRCNNCMSTREGKGCGSVAIYVHRSITVRVLCRLGQPLVYSEQPEFLFLELTLEHYKIFCGVVYSPPKTGFWSDVEEAILNCMNAYDLYILMGDFNIDWRLNSSSRVTLADSLTSCFLEPIPFASTHHTDDSHTSIDYICLSDGAPPNIRHRSYKRLNLNKLLGDWSPFYRTVDIDYKVKFLTKSLIESLDKHAPYREFFS